MKAFARTRRSYTSAIAVTAVVASLLGVAPAAHAADSAHGVSGSAIRTLAAGAIVAAPAPTITGTAKVGFTLTAVPGTWDAGVTLTYQWFANGLAVSGATAPSLALGAAQLEKRMTVAVTGTKSGYTAVTKTSAQSLAVVAGTLSATPVPAISGTAAVGSVLTAKPGTWDTGVALTYQWLANGVAISGATASALTLGSTLTTAAITVKVSGAKPGYASVSKVSAATTRIVVAATPSIVGTPTVGQQLTVKTGTWTAGVAFRYQWYAGGVAIAGATAASFTPAPAQAGTRLTVAVTGTKSGYTTVTKTSASSAAVLKATLTAGTAKVSGTAGVGQRLTATAGTWTSGTALTYQWYVGGVAVASATSSTYVIRPVDVDRTIVVKVTGTKSGYTTRTVASAATTKVAGKVYALCSAMNVDYPDGIRKASVTGDKKSGVLKPFVGTPFVSDTLYAMQSLARDADRDGIMCER